MKENIKYVTFDGLDATGKSTLIDSIQRSTKAEVIKSPPEWMRPAREKFDSTSIELRFLYYFFGNVWIDKYRLRYLLNDPKNDLILQDRSLLSTLSAHELRGLKPGWLRIGAIIGGCCRVPDKPIIIHVNPEERYQRLMGRGLCNQTDRDNLKFEDKMEQGYIKWANQLGWKAQVFDNTHLLPEEAENRLIDIIGEK